MKNSQLFFLALIMIFCTVSTLRGQEAPVEDHSYKPLTLKLNDTGSKYVRFIMWHQFWVTATQNNPGTKDVNGNLIDGTNGSSSWSTDIALRRSRFLAYAQVSPRVLILTHWGINNQSFINGATAPNGPNGTATASNQGKKPQLFLHDAWTEFRVIPTKLYIGAGLLYWNGISRLTSHSTLNFMTLDAPIFNWPNIEGTDQFARQFGIYAKGQLGRLDYRIALNKPFVNGTSPAGIAKNNQATNVFNENYATTGYINYMFWDKESNVLPFYVGSYLGSKKVLNVGAGWYSHADASLVKSAIDSVYQNHTVFGADIFMDMPVNKEKGTAISLLATLYSINYGRNYLRNIGILNEHTTAPVSSTSYSGGGNAQPTIGTGTIGYFQGGYALPKLKNGTSFMPYLTATYKNFKRLKDPSFQWGLGLNYFVTGHNAKITLEFATRPIYKVSGTDIVKDGYKSQITLQTHVFL
ncbi:MAG: porin [Saprospiraceae bacterium]|nr:porin [Saprospiraceae bacterium]